MLDLRKGIVPNYITVGGIGLALIVRFVLGAFPLMANGIIGLGIAGSILLIPFLLKGAGGGDVKMMAAAGAMVGWPAVIGLIFYTSLAGLAMGVGYLLMRPRSRARIGHWLRCAVDWRYDRAAGAQAFSVPPGEAPAKTRVPFSPAIAMGLLAVLAR